MKKVIVSGTVWFISMIMLALLPSISRAADDFGDDCASAFPVDLNSTTPGNIDYADDYDFFKVVVPATGVLTVKSVFISLPPDQKPDSYGYLFDANCSLIAEDDNTYFQEFEITHYAVPGTYIIAVRNSITNTGPYKLQVDFEPGPLPDDDFGYSCASAHLMDLDSSIQGLVNYGGDRDFFKVVVTVSGLLTTGVVKQQTSIDSYGYLYNANCLPIDENDKLADNSVHFEISRLVGPGTYFIAVKSENHAETGEYGLYVDFTPATLSDDYGNTCADAEPLALNTPRSGNINFGGDYDYFSLVVTEFGLLTVGTVEPTAIDSYGYLFDSGCQLIAQNDDAGNGNLNFQFVRYADTGTYFIAVRHLDYADGLGSYTIEADFSAGAIPGDVNLDYTVNLEDALLILKTTSGHTPEDVSASADVNGDTILDLRDALYILQVISGIR